MLQAVPLPEKQDSPTAQWMELNDRNSLSAYEKCLRLQEKFAADENQLRYARIVGYLLLEAPNPDIRHEVSLCIRSCQTDEDVLSLGIFFELHLIKAFKCNPGQTPGISRHSSRPSFEVTKAEMMALITEVPQDHKKAKQCALIRDKWKCVVTGIYHRDAPKDVLPTNVRYFSLKTQCAHIIREGILTGIEPKDVADLKNYSSSILAVLHCFCYDVKSLIGENIHALTNVMTMEMNIHEMFDSLMLYFEATSQESQYRVRRLVPDPFPIMPEFVTFSTEDSIHLPVPSPKLLALHAACCKVAHLSGSGQYIDRIMRDMDDMDVLATDGTSGDILSHALASLPDYLVNDNGLIKV